MGINGTFELGGDNVVVVIDGNNLMFADETGTITTVEGLKLDYSGVIKEFPDLKESKEWRIKALERLKEKIRSISKEIDKLMYVREELVKFGYKDLFYQRWGHRPQKFNGVMASTK